jgi:hypothetical protein
MSEIVYALPTGCHWLGLLLDQIVILQNCLVASLHSYRPLSGLRGLGAAGGLSMMPIGKSEVSATYKNED